MVCSFSRDCARSVAHAELTAGFPVPDNFFVSRYPQTLPDHGP